jgi:uncharacterized protein
VTRSLAAVLARLLFAGVALAACKAGAEVPAAPTRWVTDSAGLLSEAARQELDGRLEAYERQTGHHVLVWIGRTTGGVPIEDFTVRAFAAWHVGREGLDDGLVLFVFSDDRKLRVEVGYGLEGQVPDAIASRIIREAIVPRVQAGDRDGAIRAGVAALIAAVDGRAGAPEPAAATPDHPRPAGGASSLGLGEMVLIALVVLGFLVLLVTNPSLALYLLASAISGGRGGSSGGGGGYSGGGGRSGGGGASGSW